jgi:hypothetical protein
VHQKEFFDVFILGESFASFLRGVDQYPAVYLLTQAKHLQFAVFAYYSSVFQLVDTFLTLHGICVMPRPICGTKKTVVKRIKEGDEVREIIKSSPIRLPYQGILCKYDYRSSKWVFTPCKFKHEDRWKWFCELMELYIDSKQTIPKGIADFFGYLKVAEEFRKYRWMKKRRYSLAFSDEKEFKQMLRNLHEKKACCRFYTLILS